MKKIFFITALALTILAVGGCKKEKSNLPLDFELRLLDTLGNKKTVFNYGENIVFSFVIKNNSKSDLMFYHTKMDLDNFFKVTKNGISMGKPYSHLFCEFIGAYTLNADSIFKIEIPWIHNDKFTSGNIGCPLDSYHANTSKLPTGNYYTSFKSMFVFNEFKTDEKHFNINFTIK